MKYKEGTGKNQDQAMHAMQYTAQLMGGLRSILTDLLLLVSLLLLDAFTSTSTSSGAAATTVRSAALAARPVVTQGEKKIRSMKHGITVIPACQRRQATEYGCSTGYRSL